MAGKSIEMTGGRTLLAILLVAWPGARALAQGGASSSMGGILANALGDTRSRIIGLVEAAHTLPGELGECWSRLRANVPADDLRLLLLYLAAFVIGGIVAQWLFFLVSRPWREHIRHGEENTLQQRLLLISERFTYGLLLLGAFALGSMGTFMLFDWPASSGWIILGYLYASLLVRLSIAITRFFLAPFGARQRLVPMSTPSAWFWHYWLAALVAIASFGWQTILMLRSLGLPVSGEDLLRQVMTFALVLSGLAIVWLRPGAPVPEYCPRRRTFRVLSSFGLLLIWLLILMDASKVAWSLLTIGVAPVALHVLRHAATRVIRGHWLEPGEEKCAVGAIADRCIQAIVVVVAAYALIGIWQIDTLSVASSDTMMTRVGRGTFEALVILLGADILWQVVRLLIDLRLTGETVPIDNLNDAELRRQARVRTLLPVLRNLLFFVVLIMASLSALAAMGLQIGPLLAGAGVVGIAVGFGAQTLVRDILSGVFFLFDDAFRVGELIESGPISGVVESFSLRSVKLRHYKGHLHTVPFGDLKEITNYSRDWVSEQMQVTVSYDTDLDRVEAAIERVSAELEEDPSFDAAIIEPLVSLGVTAMVDTGMQIGLMVKTRPGRQFRVRRAVFSRLKTAFAEEGVYFASQSPVMAPVVSRVG